MGLTRTIGVLMMLASTALMGDQAYVRISREDMELAPFCVPDNDPTLVNADFDGDGLIDVAYLARQGDFGKWKNWAGNTFKTANLFLIVELRRREGGSRLIVVHSFGRATVLEGWYIAPISGGRTLAQPDNGFSDEIPIYHRNTAIKLALCERCGTVMYYWSSRRKVFLRALLFH
jgi:hypothetical protein